MFYTSKQPSKLGEFSNPEELAESLFADLDFDKDGKCYEKCLFLLAFEFYYYHLKHFHVLFTFEN